MLLFVVVRRKFCKLSSYAVLHFHLWRTASWHFVQLSAAACSVTQPALQKLQQSLQSPQPSSLHSLQKWRRAAFAIRDIFNSFARFLQCRNTLLRVRLAIIFLTD